MSIRAAGKADTPEGRIIHFADRIAYINHDIDDAIRGGTDPRGGYSAPPARQLGRYPWAAH